MAFAASEVSAQFPISMKAQQKGPARIQMKAFINKLVGVHTQSAVYTGVLLACDQYMNVVLSQTVEQNLDSD